MDKNKLNHIIENYILMLYPDTTVVDEVDFEELDYVKVNENGDVIIKGELENNKGLLLNRHQPFTNDDLELLNMLFMELNDIYRIGNIKNEYVKVLERNAIDKVITKSISPKYYGTFLEVLNQIGLYGEKTYEGNDIVYGFILNEKNLAKPGSIKFLDFLKTKFSAVLTNGEDSFIEIDRNGYILGYIQLNLEKQTLGYAPFDFTRILEVCDHSNIGCVLLSSGELLIFRDHELKYTKRGGKWSPYAHREIINQIHSKSLNDNLLFAKSIYLTSLDVSFSNRGGIIAFLNENELFGALNHIDICDIINEKYFNLKKELLIKEYTEKGKLDLVKEIDMPFEEFLKKDKGFRSACIKQLVDSRKFFVLDRKLREELVEIDGATIIDYDSEIIACGAIIKIEAGSIGGGRLAATKTLAYYGVAIDISSDRVISGYAQGDDGMSIKPIFQISYLSDN